MRTLSIPSRAISRTAASSSRSRPCDPTSGLMQPTLMSAPGLTAEQAEVQARARAFVDDVLMPLEEQVTEEHAGSDPSRIATSAAGAGGDVGGGAARLAQPASPSRCATPAASVRLR